MARRREIERVNRTTMNKDTQLIWEAFWDEETYWQDGDVKISIKDVIEIAGKPKPVHPKELKHLLIQTARDPARIQAADLTFPLLVTTKGGQYTKILDGQHRLMKALQEKLPVSVRVLNLDDAPEEFQQMFS